MEQAKLDSMQRAMEAIKLSAVEETCIGNSGAAYDAYDAYAAELEAEEIDDEPYYNASSIEETNSYERSQTSSVQIIAHLVREVENGDVLTYGSNVKLHPVTYHSTHEQETQSLTVPQGKVYYYRGYEISGSARGSFVLSLHVAGKNDNYYKEYRLTGSNRDTPPSMLWPGDSFMFEIRCPGFYTMDATITFNFIAKDE